MRKLKIMLVALVAMLTVSLPAQAQLFRWGVKAGINVNSVKFDKDELANNFKKENRTGFDGGLTAIIHLPIIGFAFDASLMYVHRVNDFKGEEVEDNFKKQDFLELPIHARYNLSLPVISNFLVPYIFTGPSFAVLCSKNSVEEVFKNKAFNTAWDFGLGVRLVNHLEIGASYGLGMSKVAEMTIGSKTVDVGKRNYWTITAAYLF